MKKTDVSNLVTGWNIQAMKYLKLGNPFSAFNLLQKASRLLSSHKSLVELHMVTLNNLGCYYKWIKRPKEALKQFENSACLKKLHLIDPISLAGTYLNISTLHSDLGSHNLALKFSQDAIETLKTADQSSGKLKITLSMAYHSLANEHYNLKNYQESLVHFQKALNLAQQSPNTEKLVEFIKTSLKKLERKLVGDEKTESSEIKTLPSIRKTFRTRKEKPNLNNPAKDTRYRFLTGDRLKPMYPQSVSPMVRSSNIGQALETIQKKIDLLQIRLEGFHRDIKPLIDVESEDLSETCFSPRMIEGFKIFNEQNKAAKLIQKNFRMYSRKREKTA